MEATISRFRYLSCATVAALALAGAAQPQDESRRTSTPRLNFYPALHLRFADGAARNYFHARASVVNVSGQTMQDLVLTQEFPEGFTPRVLEPEQVADLARPDGFSESVEGNVYTLRLPELRIAETTFLTALLAYRGRPGQVTFPGVEVAYSLAGERRTERGPDQTWDLSPYTRYSGTIQEFIKRHAGLELKLPSGHGDWGFSALAARAAGRVPMGVVAIEQEPGGRLGFSVEAGTPGSLRQLMLRRRPFNPARALQAKDEVRRYVLESVQATADFTLDPDAMSIERRKVGRFDAWVADTRWRDRVKDRLGEGPSRWYILVDDRSAAQYVVNIAAQGRGAGPGRADAPNPAREEELMADLERIVASLRIL